MRKRKYTHVKELESTITSLREAGLTRREIADALGLTKYKSKAGSIDITDATRC